jgi:SAM-dependent methyltransferase
LDTWRSYFCDDQQELAAGPQPSLQLQQRVGGSERFVYIGAQLATLLMTYVGKYRPMHKWHRVLDWGCGCARVTSQLCKLVSPSHLFGCDIDAAAIAWDQENITGPNFSQVDPYPPTNYPDGFFDVVYGVSVLTHLDEETQFRWLKELRRITAPGAILMLSVIGETLRAANMPTELSATFEASGFAAQVPYYSDWFAEFSHAGYYKEAYHSRGYVEAHWSKYFELLEYIETKHQDLVLARRA